MIRELDRPTIQERVRTWASRNFPTAQPWEPLLGAVEEMGELAHAHLKEHQGIRVNEDHEAKAKDAIGDIAIFLMHYCCLRGWDFKQIIKQTWEEVERRDWSKNKATG